MRGLLDLLRHGEPVPQACEARPRGLQAPRLRGLCAQFQGRACVSASPEHDSHSRSGSQPFESLCSGSEPKKCCKLIKMCSSIN